MNECNHEILMGENIKDEPFLCFEKTRKYKCQLCGKEMLILQYRMYEEVEKQMQKINSGEQLSFDFMSK